jgi:hypothetical protein
MKKTLSLALVTAMTCLAAVITAATAAGAAVPSYTGCLSPVLNTIYDVAPGDAPAHPPCLRPANMIRLSSGDLTSLAAGTGLTGGGDNGDLSVAIAPSYRLPQSCSAGQAASWNGTGWACAGLATQAQFDTLVALLGSAGTINDGSNPVHWTKLKGVPAGFADGTDDTGPAYTAGFGLNLAGATFSVDPTQVQQRVDNGCAEGSSIRLIAQDGGVTCQPDLGGTTYSAGEGLSLNGAEFSLAGGGVTTPKLADGAVTSAKIFDSTVALADLAFDPATQTELDALGMQGTINDAGNPVDWTRLKSVPSGFADGVDNVGAAARPRPMANQLATIDSDNNSRDVGGDTSITTGPDGLGLISYTDRYYGWLKVAHCSNAECSTATSSILPDVVSALGPGTSITVGTDGLGLISYLGGYHLKVAHCSDAECTDATTSTVDTASQVGFESSITVGADGLGLISYYDADAGNLKVAHCSNTACSAATTTTLDTQGFMGQFTSIAIGADGLGLISYQDASNSDLKVAHCSNVTCSAATTSTLDSGSDLVGQYTSIVIGADGLGLISYYDQGFDDVKVAHCSNVMCSTATLSTLDGVGAGVLGLYTSVTLGADGLGVVSYYDIANGDLKVAHCANTACTTGSSVAVDTSGDVGSYDSITSGGDGLGLIAYYDTTNRDLKVAHLSNPFGAPYFRRR